MTLTTDFLVIAEADLKAARVLHKKGRFPQAVFYFQQSVEKANKALEALSNKTTEIDLRKRVGHDTVNIYVSRVTEQKKKYEHINEFFNKFPESKELYLFRPLKRFDLQKQIKNSDLLLSYLDRIKKNKRQSIFMSSKEISRFLKKIGSYNKDDKKTKLKHSKFKITKRQWNKLKRGILQFSIFISKYNPAQADEAKKELEKIDKKLFEQILKKIAEFANIFMPLTMTLFYLAVVTLPHSSSTRYPQDGLDPIKIYTKKLPIVKLLPRLFKVHDNALKNFRILNKKLEVQNANI